MRLGLLAAATLAMTCKVTLGDNLTYTCADDADCAGGGYVCANPNVRGYCCKPTGAEVCDEKDNDCDGVIDDVGTTVELCNGIDDNCNGQIDEGFNLQADPMNCGHCGTVCGDKQVCTGGQCITRAETSCVDGIDNDDNGLTDCADPACNMIHCGTSSGCTCLNGTKTETNCGNGLDDDGDGLTDCADPDCHAASCGTGCTCGVDGGLTESNCGNDYDDDNDGLTDCEDPDCAGKICGSPTVTFTCDPLHQCNCNGGAQVAEAGALCSDGIDNDCDGTVDCGDADCDSAPCTTGDGGTGTCSNMTCQ